jgi:hypothetical protein
VFFNAIYSDDKNSPNHSYSQALPQASLRMAITNPAAFDQFKPQKVYDPVFTEY